MCKTQVVSRKDEDDKGVMTITMMRSRMGRMSKISRGMMMMPRLSSSTGISVVVAVVVLVFLFVLVLVLVSVFVFVFVLVLV